MVSIKDCRNQHSKTGSHSSDRCLGTGRVVSLDIARNCSGTAVCSDFSLRDCPSTCLEYFLATNAKTASDLTLGRFAEFAQQEDGAFKRTAETVRVCPTNRTCRYSDTCFLSPLAMQLSFPRSTANLIYQIRPIRQAQNLLTRKNTGVFAGWKIIAELLPNWWIVYCRTVDEVYTSPVGCEQ